MKTFIQKEKIISVEHSITCDKCVFEVLVDEDDEKYETADILEAQEFVKINIECGFNAKLGDGNRYTLDLCQHCTVDLLGPYLQKQD